jgi:hypothetical protein
MQSPTFVFETTSCLSFVSKNQTSDVSYTTICGQFILYKIDVAIRTFTPLLCAYLQVRWLNHLICLFQA